MRKILTLMIISFLLNAANAKSQTVYNSGFEQLNADGTISNWGNVYLGSVWFDSLGVSHSDSIVYDGQYYAPTNDAHSGNTALELRNAWDFTTNTGIAGAVASDDDSVFNAYGLLNLVPTYATPFSPFAPFNFGFYYKFSQVNGDSAFAQIALWDSSGNQLAEGNLIITDTTSNYKLIYAAVNYSDTGVAAFYSLKISTFYSAFPGSHQPGFGTRLLVDDVGFNFVSANIAGANININDFSVFPNPANGTININSNINAPATFKIHNMLGQTMLEGNLPENQNTFSIDNFERGIYIIEIRSMERVVSCRVVVE